MRNKKQIGGDQSANHQAETITINNYGPTIKEVMQIAIDVFDLNFPRLTDKALEITNHRIKEFTENLLKRIYRIDPLLLSNFSEPGLQILLLNAQKEYAKSGDADEAEILMNVLFEKVKNPFKSLFTINVEQSLFAIPKLTNEHIQLLTLSYALTSRFVIKQIRNHDDFISFINSDICSLASNFNYNTNDFDHLKHLGCISENRIEHSPFCDRWKQLYSGFFSTGFSMEDLLSVGKSSRMLQGYLITCPKDEKKYQFSAFNAHDILELLQDSGLTSDEIRDVRSMYTKTLPDRELVHDILIELNPKIKEIISKWDSKDKILDWHKKGIRNFDLTPIGEIIANANYFKLTNRYIDLSNN